MNTIELQRTLPAVFAGRDSIISDVWHQLLTLQRGEAYLVEAASGTGKSSLCSYIYGYRNDYQGIICFGEKNIRSLSVHDWVEIRKRSISMLFQELRLFTELTAWENVQLKNSLTGFKSKKEIKAWRCFSLFFSAACDCPFCSFYCGSFDFDIPLFVY